MDQRISARRGERLALGDCRNILRRPTAGNRSSEATRIHSPEWLDAELKAGCCLAMVARARQGVDRDPAPLLLLAPVLARPAGAVVPFLGVGQVEFNAGNYTPRSKLRLGRFRPWAIPVVPRANARGQPARPGPPQRKGFGGTRRVCILFLLRQVRRATIPNHSDISYSPCASLVSGTPLAGGTARCWN